MPTITVSLLGPVSITVGDGPAGRVQLGAKPLALLAYLLLEPGPHTREQLAALLWGEHPKAAARASLRQTLMQLRDFLGDALRVTRTTVEFVGSVECDAVEFLGRARADPRAAAVYDVSRFLSELSVRHSPAFEEWAAETRKALCRRQEEALAGLAREAAGKWQWRDAAAHAERWLASDPLADEPARLLVEALYLSGDRSAALRVFHDFRGRVRAEAGGEPSRALLQLVQRIEADPATTPARPISQEWYAHAPSFECNLVGRVRELAALQRAWRAVGQGTGRVALIEGEAGVGKTRLVDEFLRWVAAEFGIVLRSRGYDARSGVPYGPIADAFRGVLDAPGLAGADPQWLAEAARLLPELRHRFRTLPDTTPSPAPADVWRLFEALAQLLLAIAAEQPIVLSVDDLHWCDPDSCNLLHSLTRRLESAPVLWCATLTLGELERDAAAARLTRVLRAKPDALVVSLPPLSEDEVWRLIRELGHVSAPMSGRRFAARIHQVTAGNLFYIVELLKTLFAQGWLTADRDSGEWLASADSEAPPVSMSPTVHDAIAERIESLPSDLHELLITIAVADTGCRTDLLSHAHGISRLRAAILADELVDRRLVVEEAGSYRPAHPVIARVGRERLTTSRRREVHRVIALSLDLLTSSQARPVPPGEIARHAELGGERALTYRYAVAANRAAMQHYAVDEALSWLDLAAAAAANSDEADAADRLTAEVLSVAGWREAPAPARRLEAVPREIEREDLDLPVRR